MFSFPTSVEQAIASTGEFRAGGTDLQDRRRTGKATGPVVDLKHLSLESIIVDGLDANSKVSDPNGEVGPLALDAVASASGGLSIGARTTVATIARNSEIQLG